MKWVKAVSHGISLSHAHGSPMIPLGGDYPDHLVHLIMINMACSSQGRGSELRELREQPFFPARSAGYLRYRVLKPG